MSALAELEKRLQSTNALIIQYQNALATPDNEENRNSISVSLRSLQKLHRRLEGEFLELAALQEQEVYRYRIIQGQERPSLGGVADAWVKFQNVFSVIYSKLTNSPMPTPLGYGYCFEGSVGVVVTLPKLPPTTIGLLTGNPIDDTSEIVFDLVEKRRIPEIARDLGPGPIAAMNDWLTVHVAHNYGLGLEWHSQRQIRRHAELPADQLQTVQTQIIEASTTSTLTLNGELYAVDADAKVFKVKADDGQDIQGTFETAITQEHAASVPSRYKVTIVKTTRMIPTKKEKPETYFLESLEPLGQKKI
jgi:hypothetical protein